MSAYTLEIIVQVCVAIITVVSVYLLTGLGGMMSFGQAMYMGIGAYVTFVAANKLGLPVFLTAILAIIFSGLWAFVVALPTLKLRKDYFSLVSVAVCQAMTAIIIALKDVTNGALGFYKIPKTKGLVYIALGFTALIIVLVRNFKYSRFGRMSMALKNDELAAKSFGIRTFKLKTMVYVIASMMAGLGGILYAMQTRFIEPATFGWTKSSEMIIFLFFGGTNSLSGSVISAAVLRALPEFLRNITLFGHSIQEYRTILYCILILIMLNFKPSGLFGEREISLKGIKNFFSNIGHKKGGKE